jgi:hypothetical protein
MIHSRKNMPLCQPGLKTPLRHSANTIGVMKQFAARLGSSSDAKFKRFGTTVRQLCVDAGSDLAADPEPTKEAVPTPTPAPAGSVAVLDQLKRLREMSLDNPAPSTT